MNWDQSGDTKEKKCNPTGINKVNNKPKLLTKPAKVPVWTKDLTLETYIKQIQSWSDDLEEIPDQYSNQRFAKVCWRTYSSSP